MSDNMEFMAAIAREIVHCGELDGMDWVEVSAVFGMDDEGGVSESHGYAYDREGHPQAAAFLYDPVERAVARYSEWLRKDRDRPILRMLFQFNRESLKVNAEFEYEDRARWQVTPANIDTMVVALRPRLGGR